VVDVAFHLSPRHPPEPFFAVTRVPGSYWTFWPNPDPDSIGTSSYQWGFLLKVDLVAVLGLLGLFALPPMQRWTGCDLRILAAGFFIHFFAAIGIVIYGTDRLNPRLREFISHLTNMIAVVAIPLSTEKALLPLWILYFLVVWMDGYSNPKSLSSLLTSVSIPWIDPLWHAHEASFENKVLMVGVSVGLGVVVYLVSSYFTAWERAAARRKAAMDREQALKAERERIGQSLHGTLGAALSEISLWHEIALAGGAASDADPLSRAQARAQSALQDLRSLVAGLDGESIAAANLSAGIRRQIEGLCAAAHVQLTFDEARAGSQDMSSAYHIAKIIVESVTNAVKHARATHIHVTLDLSPLQVSIRDDGAGFDANGVTRGRGLRSLHEHAQALGSTLVLDTAPGAGTHVSLKFPTP
jgi:signal transduction histidine kinase